MYSYSDQDILIYSHECHGSMFVCLCHSNTGFGQCASNLVTPRSLTHEHLIISKYLRYKIDREF